MGYKIGVLARKIRENRWDTKIGVLARKIRKNRWDTKLEFGHENSLN